MICKNCGFAVPEGDLNCPSCGNTAARTRADLQKIDSKMTRTIAWAVIAMGLMGLVFVIANSWTDWYSALDYVGPVALLLVGSAALYSARSKK